MGQDLPRAHQEVADWDAQKGLFPNGFISED